MARLTAGVALILLALSFQPRPAAAWGAEGHRVIALIAQTYLSPDVRSRVISMLAGDTGNMLTAHDMADDSTWADRIREENVDGAKHGTSQWHYVDIEVAHPDEDAACFGHPSLPTGETAYPGIAKDCIIDKLVQFEAELKSKDTPVSERTIALKFVLHLVGDLHQPLHAADEADRGGNEKEVKTVKEHSEKLHAFWDTAVVSRIGRNPQAVANGLAAKITSEERTRWARGTPAEWAMETFEVGKADAYGRLPPAAADGVYHLNDTYEAMATKDAAEQLSKAGVRLAAVLDAALERVPAP